MTDWQPQQYNRFAAERRQPFDELVALCRPIPGGVAYDLGCGPGKLTVDLAERLDARLVIGHDTSPAMLEKASSLASEQVRFETGDLASFTAQEPADLIFANAALHWVGHHDQVLARWREQLASGGQIAVQVPTNLDHPVYAMAAAVATESVDLFPAGPPPPVVESVLVPERYAEILHGLGGREIHVGLRVFCHVLDSTDDAVEWIKGTSLLAYKNALAVEGADDNPAYDEFERRFRARVIAELGNQRPYLFTFKRILMWAQFD